MLDGPLELLSNTQDAVFIVDSDQRIVVWNKAAERILGYKPEDALGQYCFELLEGNLPCSEGTCQKNCNVFELTRQNLPPPTYTRLIRCKDANTHWLRLTHIGIPLSAKSTQAVVVHLVNDIGEQMRDRQLLERLAGYAKEQPDRFGSIEEDPPPPVPEPQLTNREVEVLRMLAEGARTKDIAVRMRIQVSTVRNYIQKILEELGVHTRLEAVLVAIEQKLVHPRR